MSFFLLRPLFLVFGLVAAGWVRGQQFDSTMGLPVVQVQPPEVFQDWEPVEFLCGIYSPGIYAGFVHNRDLEAVDWQWFTHDTVRCYDEQTNDYFACGIYRFDLRPRPDAHGELYYRFAEKLPLLAGLQERLDTAMAEFASSPDASPARLAYIHCIIEKDGRVSNVRPYSLRELYDLPGHSAFQAAAARAVAALPRWRPAEHRGKIVRCSVIIRMLY